MRRRRSFSALPAMCCLCLFAGAHAGETLPVEHFAILPQFSKPMISPDGKRIAVTRIARGEPALYIHKLLTPGDEVKEPPVPVSAGDYFVDWYDWANNDRLIVRIRGTAKTRRGLVNLTRMASVSRLGEPAVGLDMSPNNFGVYRQHVSVLSWLEDDPDHILATLDDNPDVWGAPEVDLVNVNTGKKQRVLKNPKGVYRWIADGEGRVRAGVKFKDRSSLVTIYYREDEQADWEILQRVNYFDHDKLIPFGFDDDDPNILLVSTSPDLMEAKGGKEAFRYDLTTREVVGTYVDKYYKQVVKIVQRALPGRKLHLVSHDNARKNYLFRAYSDAHVPEYYRLDLNRKSLDYLAAEYPELVETEFAHMEPLAYRARDGLQIPAFLTVPRGAVKKNLPLVVYPHGGPWARDEWGWDNYVQFLANRGYAVLQPQFRGSTGFGIAHLEAGYGQWGAAIQDDITDGVKWLVEQGIADPDRICIIGASFGGYAAAMGAAKTPELYRCAVSINGVMNLKKFIDSSGALYFESVNRAIWNERSEAERFSPYHLADTIQAPMLLIGSERDTVVPVDHSKRMYKKLKKLKKPVKFIELPDGEHWRSIEANELTVFKALEAFLAEHIGGA